MAIEERGMMDEIDGVEVEESEESIFEPVTLDTTKLPELKVGDVVRYRVTSIDDGIATAEYDTGKRKASKGVRALADEFE